MTDTSKKALAWLILSPFVIAFIPVAALGIMLSVIGRIITFPFRWAMKQVDPCA